VSRITREEVLKVAELARLSLTEAEARAMTSQLDTILEYAQALQALDTEGIEPTSHPIPMQTPLREDRPAAVLPSEKAVANAPEKEDTAFLVPKVLDADEA
jgi:aspartyl-tRNA(Asn)/glutamyl-tRNA(Gln) amidotransferase subunit C